MGTGMGDRGGEGPAYLGGIGLQGVQLVHGEAELVEVDIHIDQQVRGQGRGKHPLWGRQAGRMRAGQTQAPKNHLGGSQPLFYGLGLPDSSGAPGNFLLHWAWEPLTQTRGDVSGGHRMEAKDSIPENCA